MFKTRSLLAAQAVFALAAAAACSTEVGPTDSAGSTSQASSSCEAGYAQCGGQNFTGSTCCVSGFTCTFSNAFYSQCTPNGSGSSSGGSSSSSSSGGGTPPPPTTQDLQRAAASAAFSIMKAAAIACSGNESGAFGGPCFGTDILASQRYTVSGNTIVFDSNAQSVPTGAKMALAVAQLDSDVANFLVQGLQWDRANTTGHAVALMMPIQALAHFTFPGNSTPIPIVDGAAGGNRRSEVVTGTSSSSVAKIHFFDHSTFETGFSPFNVITDAQANVTNTVSNNYKGGSNFPTTPFNGSGNNNNPFVVMAVNGQTINWNTNGSSFPTQTCNSNPDCTGTLDIDPIPYTQPGDYYDANGNEVGPQSNPFQAVITDLYADPSHAGQWATRTVAGVQQWGTFSNPVNVLGGTVYQYVKQM